jgi:hypothetical protein
MIALLRCGVVIVIDSSLSSWTKDASALRGGNVTVKERRSVEGGAVEVAMTDEMAAVFAEVALCPPSLLASLD